ncbi:PD40 domain-containing protein [Candidatus Sumerlaeota bacterium]|nr:PD40 domain-containing protein [Candidatus Sumerlaeota bacterium]
MSKRSRKLVFTMTAAATLALLIAAGCRPTSRTLPEECSEPGRLPHIRPDYNATVIPPNIAPLNFIVEEPGIEYRTRIHGDQGEDILIASRNPTVVIPEEPWRELLQANRGGKIGLDIYVKTQDGRWTHFEKIENTVAQETIDSHLAYRLLGPVGNFYRKIGIYQRNLENYDESPIVTNDTFGGCINCHSFRDNNPDCFSFHVRPGPINIKATSGMIVARDGHAARLQTKSELVPGPPGYLSWRRDGLSVAFAYGKPRQYFRSCGPEIRDVYDIWSNVAIADGKTGATSSSPDLTTTDHLETFPCWSADGKALYYCSAQAFWNPDEMPDPVDIMRIKFDLMRVPYDVEYNTWGQPEKLLTAAETHKTILEPRTSPDGRFLLFCMSDYGGFPINQASCDLYMMDLESGKHRRLECNSDKTDSWHCWSSNSRWIVFSSKRENELLARPFFSYIDAEGREHKPFILPQKDPAFYDAYLKTYNVPELITGPVTVPEDELVQAVLSGQSASQGGATSKPAWQSTAGKTAADKPNWQAVDDDAYSHE